MPYLKLKSSHLLDDSGFFKIMAPLGQLQKLIGVKCCIFLHVHAETLKKLGFPLPHVECFSVCDKCAGHQGILSESGGKLGSPNSLKRGKFSTVQ